MSDDPEHPEFYPLRASAEAIQLQPADVKFTYAGQFDGVDVAAVHITDHRVGEVVLPLSMDGAYAMAAGLLQVVAGQDELRAEWLARNGAAGNVAGEGN